MKKLLLILLCVPLIGFGQDSVLVTYTVEDEFGDKSISTLKNKLF